MKQKQNKKQICCGFTPFLKYLAPIDQTNKATVSYNISFKIVKLMGWYFCKKKLKKKTNLPKQLFGS